MDLKRIDQQPVTGLDRVGATLLEAEVRGIQEHPVRAVRVDDIELTVRVLNGGVPARDKLVGQHPGIAANPSDRAAFGRENDAAVLTEPARLSSDYFQLQEHSGALPEGKPCRKGQIGGLATGYRSSDRSRGPEAWE